MNHLEKYAPLITFAALSALVLWYDQLNADTSWYLISTEWWLQGVPIYQEILEPNPPLMYYLYVPPVYLAGLTGLSAILLLKLYIISIAAVSLFWAHRIFIASGQFSHGEIAWLTILASFGLLVIPMIALGEREHFLILFTWPYIALSIVMSKNQPRMSPALVGLYASFGFAIKPFFLAIPVFLTISQIIQSRSYRWVFSPQNLVIFGFCVIYVCAAYFLHPAYFSKIIPQALLTYGAYKRDFIYVFFYMYGPILLFFFVRYAANRLAETGDTVGPFLISATMAGIASYFVQSKGWYYHAAPFISYLLITAGWVVYGSLKQRKNYILSVLIVGASIWAILYPAMNVSKIQNPVSLVFARYFTCPKGQRNFQMLSANVWPGFPLPHVADAQPTSRSPALWRFPGLVRKLNASKDEAERKKLAALMQEARADAIHDLIRGNPQLVFVDARDRKSYFRDEKFSYIAYFSQLPEFLPIWEKYEKVGHEFGFDIYRREGCGI
jgi:hypothetical protein